MMVIVIICIFSIFCFCAWCFRTLFGALDCVKERRKGGMEVKDLGDLLMGSLELLESFVD